MLIQMSCMYMKLSALCTEAFKRCRSGALALEPEASANILSPVPTQTANVLLMSVSAALATSVLLQHVYLVQGPQLLVPAMSSTIFRTLKQCTIQLISLHLFRSAVIQV